MKCLYYGNISNEFCKIKRNSFECTFKDGKCIPANLLETKKEKYNLDIIYKKKPRKDRPICKTCDKQINHGNKSGYCSKCYGKYVRRKIKQ